MVLPNQNGHHQHLHAAADPLTNVLSHFPSARAVGTNRYEACCPVATHGKDGRGDREPSLSIGVGDDGRVLLYCFGGCATERVVSAIGLQMVDLFPKDSRDARRVSRPRSRQAERRGNLMRASKPTYPGYANQTEAIASLLEYQQKRARGNAGEAGRTISLHREYRYFTASGDNDFTVVRLAVTTSDAAPDKDIRPIRLDEDGRWRAGKKSNAQLYMAECHRGRLPDGPIYVVEGEKCVVAAHTIGINAVTSAGGSSAARQSDWAGLAGRDVVIVPDADNAGERYASDVASLLKGVAKSVKIVDLVPPAGVEKSAGFDIADWLDLGELDSRDSEDLRRMIEAMPARPMPAVSDMPANAGTEIESRNASIIGELVDDAVAMAADPFPIRQTPRIADAFVAERFTSGPHRLLHFYGDRFYAWREGNYEAIEDRKVMRDVASWLERQHAIEPSGHVVQMPVTPGMVEQVTDMLRTRLYLDSRNSPPFWIAGEKPATEWIACKTTMFNTDTGELRPRTPELFTVGSLSFDPDLSGREPARWLSILHQQFADDAAQVDVMQEFAGYTLVDGNPYQKGLLVVGPTRSGKGEMIRTIEQLQPPSMAAAVRASTFVGGFALSQVLGKRLVTVGDWRPKDDRAAHAFVEVLLPAIGADGVDVDRKYKDAVTARIGAKFVIAANSLPRLPDDAGAIAQRLLILKTQVSMAGREDFALRKALDEELPLIFGWAWRGLSRLRKQGRFTALNNEAAEELRSAGSVIRGFVDECCELDGASATPKDDLFARFQQWSRDNGEPPMKHSDFKGAIETAFAGQVQFKQSRQLNRGRGYIGIRLRMRIAQAEPAVAVA